LNFLYVLKKGEESGVILAGAARQNNTTPTSQSEKAAFEWLKSAGSSDWHMTIDE
jgi:hypothetical protein